jgi:hypothetical protein
MKIKLKTMKPRNLVAKDLRTPKYRMRVILSKKKTVPVFDFKKEVDYV